MELEERRGFTRRRGDAEGRPRDCDGITGDVLDAAIAIHRDLGPGLLETVYEMLLAGRLERMGYTKQPVGLLINFNEVLSKDGFHRIVNDYRPTTSSSSASPRLRVNQLSSAARN
jgi:PD-(D/E)XK nuclease superfamily